MTVTLDDQQRLALILRMLLDLAERGGLASDDRSIAAEALINCFWEVFQEDEEAAEFVTRQIKEILEASEVEDTDEGWKVS